MNEQEWLTGDLHQSLELLHGRGSDRKLELFSCACCRRVWHYLDEADREFVESAERIVEGTGTTLDVARVEEVEGNWHTPRTDAGRFLGCLFHGRVSRTPVQIQWFLSHIHQPGEGRNTESSRVELLSQILLLRDIFGNPFRTIAFNAAWRTSDVMLLANGIYAERAFDRMPILADALQDAGCDSDDILNHLRDATATHVRGCWALDLVLGKE